MVDGVASFRSIKRDHRDPTVTFDANCHCGAPVDALDVVAWTDSVVAARSMAVSMSNTPSGSQATRPNDPALDPVRVKRARIAKWTLLANRVGYLFVALAMALFFMAFLFGFTSVMATLVIMSLVIGCVLLAPSIILGYAVKAADRDDRERGL
jgi:hypothetical protein